MKVYNKLVGDRIPQIIEADGKRYDIRNADRKEHYELLEAKLEEEVKEFLMDKNLDELAEVMEVLYGLADNLGYSEEDLNQRRIGKREKRGVFKEGIVLERVYE